MIKQGRVRTGGQICWILERKERIHRPPSETTSFIYAERVDPESFSQYASLLSHDGGWAYNKTCKDFYDENRPYKIKEAKTEHDKPTTHFHSGSMYLRFPCWERMLPNVKVTGFHAMVVFNTICFKVIILFIFMINSIKNYRRNVGLHCSKKKTWINQILGVMDFNFWFCCRDIKQILTLFDFTSIVQNLTNLAPWQSYTIHLLLKVWRTYCNPKQRLQSSEAQLLMLYSRYKTK